jgi:hypothetical protein
MCQPGNGTRERSNSLFYSNFSCGNSPDPVRSILILSTLRTKIPVHEPLGDKLFLNQGIHITFIMIFIDGTTGSNNGGYMYITTQHLSSVSIYFSVDFLETFILFTYISIATFLIFISGLSDS